MRKNRFLFIIAFAMFIVLPFRVNAMKLNAYDYDGNSKTIEVESSDTIEAVKEKIGMKTGKTVDDTILIFNGKELENGRTLVDYPIKENDVIYMLGDFYVILNANEGTFENLPSGQTEYIVPDYEERQKLESIIPKKDGYIFKGWYTEADGGYIIEYYVSEFDIEGGKTFYAHWDKEGTITIDFTKIKNSENFSDIETELFEFVAENGDFVIDQTTNSLKDKNGKTLFSIDNDKNIVLNNDLNASDNYIYTLTDTDKQALTQQISYVPDTVEFIFSTEEVYKVVFDANGGTFENNIKTIETEDIINFDYEGLKKPTRDGYKFIGFYTKEGKSYLEVMNSEAGIEEDTTFYAKWEENSAGTSGETTQPEIENPKTFDGIGTSIFMGTISLIGLMGITIYLKKKNKVRAN